MASIYVVFPFFMTLVGTELFEGGHRLLHGQQVLFPVCCYPLLLLLLLHYILLCLRLFRQKVYNVSYINLNGLFTAFHCDNNCIRLHWLALCGWLTGTLTLGDEGIGSYKLSDFSPNRFSAMLLPFLLLLYNFLPLLLNCCTASLCNARCMGSDSNFLKLAEV